MPLLFSPPTRTRLPAAVAWIVTIIFSAPSSAQPWDFGDLNCDGKASIIDVQLGIMAALGQPLDPTIDADTNGRPDLCDELPVGVCGAGTKLVDGVCVVVQSCENDGDPCDDGDLCTENDVWFDGQCTAGNAIECDDENPCTLDKCEAISGCMFQAISGPLCDDGDPCTVADSCKAGVCSPGFEVSGPACAKVEGTACSLHGPTGSVVDCDIKVVSGSSEDPFATGLQFTVAFDASAAAIVNFFGETCIIMPDPQPPLCYEAPLTGLGAKSTKSGHTISISPSIPSWNATPCEAGVCVDGGSCIAGLCEGTGGFGGAVIVNLANSSAPITTAYLDMLDVVHGDPLFAVARFELQKDIPDSEPLEVVINDAAASAAGAVPLDVNVYDELIVTSEAEFIGPPADPILPLHTGDINNDGKVDVNDVNCYIEAALANAQGAPAPGCQAFPDDDVDLQCDGAIDVTDIQRIILIVLYELTEEQEVADLLSAKDPDLDLLHDACDPDDDGDGAPDACEQDAGTDPLDPDEVPSDCP